MFTKRNGLKTDVFDNKLNKDFFDYKYYNTDEKTGIHMEPLIRNNHGLLELQFNLSDAVLKGSSDSFDQIEEVISTYQLQFNMYRLFRDAYVRCKESE